MTEEKYYKLKVAGLERDLPICPVNEHLDIAGFIIFGDVELTEACARELIKKIPEHDYMITAEAKGIPLIYEMARQMGEKKHFIALKSRKGLYARCGFGGCSFHHHQSRTAFVSRRLRRTAYEGQKDSSGR